MFKNSNNVYLTRELFLETATDPSRALFTLQDEDVGEYKSMYLLYMEANDPTEYTFAKSVLQSWEHWEKLSNASFLVPHVQKWRKELEIKIRSEAVLKIREVGQKGGRDGFSANKYLADRGYDNPRATKGRPSKEDVRKAATDIAAGRSREDEDLKRLMN